MEENDSAITEQTFDAPAINASGDTLDTESDLERAEQEIIADNDTGTAENPLETEGETTVDAGTLAPVGKRKKAKRILRIDLEHDIKYRGPLSYRGLRALAWICITIGVLGAIMKFGAKYDAGFEKNFGAVITLCTSIMNYSTPLFLIAAFATILNKSRKFSSLLMTYGLFSVLFYALFVLLYDRYLIGLVMAFMDSDRESATLLVEFVLSLITKNGYFAFNIFIDLFLCTLFTYFVAARPKHVFTGKKVIIFRLFALLPLLYEIASVVIKMLAEMSIITLSTFIYPLLTTKPPMTFLIFIALAYFLKRRSRIYRKNGKTQDEFDSFLQTKANSLHFSIYASVVIVIVAILDVMLLLIIGLATMNLFPGETITDSLAASLSAVYNLGFGQSAQLVTIIPIIMLFSYSKSYKNTKWDIILPIVGLIIVILVSLEGLYQLGIRVPGVIKSFFNK